ncbi:MAG: M48 family metallopeptidase [Calditrichia bacterium]|nr:M48 family metallopeptidase [Calditrichia bacterium]
MPDSHIETIFNTVQRQYFKTKYKKIDVEFYKFRSLKHTIEWTLWRIRIRVNEHFRHAPERIIELLAIILLAKVYKVKVGRDIRKSYNDYIEILKESLPVKKHNRLDAYTAKGEIFDLTKIFNQLNALYFGSNLKIPVLGWSRKNSYWRLGFYDKERDLLVISRVFDQSAVPEDIVRYMVYHEMLHIYYPSERKNGRRVIHPPAFRKTEKQFPGYKDIQNWLKSNLREL